MKTFLHKHRDVSFSVVESGEGQPMIFQHGLCGDALQPADVFPDDIGWRCLTLECRGHGHSDSGPLEDLSIASFVDDLVSFIESQHLAPVVLGGISMGAAIALRLAVLRRDLVSALVLARPAWSTGSAPPNMQPNALVGELLRELPPEQARIQFEGSEIAQVLAESAPDNLASLRGFFSRQPLTVTQELLCRISADGPGVTQSEVAAVSIPTLVIGHERDFVHPLEKARQLAELIPDAHLITITPKADNRDLYRSDFKAALSIFLKELNP
jgi:pimeloyl-ACP methyl ester carboxylesterase